MKYPPNLRLDGITGEELARLADAFDKLSEHAARLMPHFRDHVTEAATELTGAAERLTGQAGPGGGS